MNKLLIIFIFLLTGCESKDPVTRFSGNAMTMEYKVIVGQHLGKKQTEQVKSILLQTFHEVDAIYNKWNPSSELCKLNALNANEKFKISKEMEHLLILSQEVVSISEGRFDPTIEPLQKLWKEKLRVGELPSESAISECLPSIGFDRIHFQDGFFWKDHDKCSLDLGGIAKGYCIDLIVQRLSQAGYQNLFVEWGGEIHAIGSHPEGRPWNIFISRFGDTRVENAIALIPLNNESIATSGDYLQKWSVNNIHYCHIIDPKTHRPLIKTNESIGSTSVVAKNCAFADGLATAAMIFPNVEEAKNWACKVQESFPEVQFWIISN